MQWTLEPVIDRAATLTSMTLAVVKDTHP